MADGDADLQKEQGILERESLCLARNGHTGMILHKGDRSFKEELGNVCPTAESNASEILVNLKSRLRTLDVEDFWPQLAEGMAELLDASYFFVSKRIVLDDQDVAVEMPPIGQPGSCLMAVAMYWNDRKDLNGNIRNLKYSAYGCPCAYMKHDKVFLVPEKLEQIFSPKENPNSAGLPIPCEAYLGVPLYSGGKCFAHFGVMWSPEAAARRNLSWTFLEMLMHAVEDMIVARLVEGDSFTKIPQPVSQQREVVPYEAVTAAQSLKPYARSLSHELRTPMQGVVGMLDVMHATVQEAAEAQTYPRNQKIFQTLKENIEVVQDSSRRAVEAADNVVYAYDMNMGVPDAPSSPLDDDEHHQIHSFKIEHGPEIVVNGSNMPLNTTSPKRKRTDVSDSTEHRKKVHITQFTTTIAQDWPSTDAVNGVKSASRIVCTADGTAQTSGPDSADLTDVLQSPITAYEQFIVPGCRNTDLREVLQYVINDSLKVGGRPESAIAQETDGGEIIEVRTRSGNGTEQVKMIDWSVDPAVPDTMFIDEKDLTKMISCVFLNAVKFTDEGRITVTARLSPRYRYVVIKIKDTGSGIPSAFLPNLFKPFSREDDSLTRQSEGLGLGLLVAKGLARKLKGDLFCTRSEVDGPNRGTEFEMRVPITPGDACSRWSTPIGSPAPSSRSGQSAEADVPPLNVCTMPHHPKSFFVANTLRDAVGNQRQPTTPPPSSHLSSTPTMMDSPVQPLPATPPRRPSLGNNRRASSKKMTFDRDLAQKYPLTFLVAEDNKINRSLLVNMLRKFGYSNIYQAYDGADAVRQMQIDRGNDQDIDVVLMDLWMPFMNGYEAAERILNMEKEGKNGIKAKPPTILAVTADVTDGALERAAKAGMKGFMTKPYGLLDLERLIVDHCTSKGSEGMR